MAICTEASTSTSERNIMARYFIEMKNERNALGIRPLESRRSRSLMSSTDWLYQMPSISAHNE